MAPLLNERCTRYKSPARSERYNFGFRLPIQVVKRLKPASKKPLTDLIQPTCSIMGARSGLSNSMGFDKTSYLACHNITICATI